MTRYLLRRALWGLLTLFILVTIIFFATQILMPGDFASQFRLFMSESEVNEMREHLGLDLPLSKQYLNWLSRLLHGNLGISYRNGQGVADILFSVLPLTIFLFGMGTIIAFLLGQWLGKLTVWQGSRLTSGASTLGAIMLYTSFPPWLAFLMTYFFARRMSIFRNLFALESSRQLWAGSDLPAVRVLWIMLATIAGAAMMLAIANQFLKRRWRRPLPNMLSILVMLAGPLTIWYLLDLGPRSVDIMFTLALPLLTYVCLSFGETMLIMRTCMMDTIHEQYIFTARAKGLPEHIVRDKHAARNALLPVLSRLVTSVPYLLTGLIILEYSFGFSNRSGLARLQGGPDTWGGLGSAMFGALVNQDMLVVVGALLLIGVLSLVARLFLDVLHAYLDPRIRYDTSSASEP